jgi:hypothetical protein
MKRLAWSVGLLTCLCGLIRADDIYMIDPKNPTKAPNKESGIIEDETPAGIKIKKAGKDVLLPALNIDRVTYNHPKVDATTIRTPDNELDWGLDKDSKKRKPEERKKHLADALAGFEKLSKEVADSERAFRYTRYRVAYTRVMQVREDPTQIKPAIDALKTFTALPKNMAGWEAIPALELLADLQQKQGDIQGASQTLEQMVKLDGLPPDMKQARTLAAANLLLRTKDYPAAEKRLQVAIAGMAANDPQKARLQAYVVKTQIKQNNLSQVEANLNKVLEMANDPETRAVAHNLLGDYYLAKKQDEEAFWQYLRVHVLYKDDFEEHAKALYYLSKLFVSVKKDPAKAVECQQALMREELARTEYGQLAAEERKTTEP